MIIYKIFEAFQILATKDLYSLYCHFPERTPILLHQMYHAFSRPCRTDLRIYGQENGWIMIRYPSDANKGYRYGWVAPTAISAANQARTPQVDFAYQPAITTKKCDATDDPDRSIQYGGTTVSNHVTVTALAFLNEQRTWVYCEYNLREGSKTYIARGFIPADSLKLQ